MAFCYPQKSKLYSFSAWIDSNCCANTLPPLIPFPSALLPSLLRRDSNAVPARHIENAAKDHNVLLNISLNDMF